MAKSQQVFSSDNALTDPKDDLLGYAPFARTLAKGLCDMTPPEGLVVALYGKWGMGKTTLVNFIYHYLCVDPEFEGKRPFVIKFNPWWFSGSENLTRKFFDQLIATFKKWKAKGEKLRNKLADLANVISTIPLPYFATAKGAEKLLRVQGKDVGKLKDEVEKILKAQPQRILIVIDDVDRLVEDEIRELIGFIKAVGNFSNTTYLLAFDREVVIKALGGSNDYLEKIVQLSFELPVPDQTSLDKIFFKKLGAILVDTSEESSDNKYWSTIYLNGLQHCIEKPRDIIRLVNSLQVSYPAVKGEVNPIDLIAIEAIRVFYPTIYDVIRRNPKAFTEEPQDHGFSSFTKQAFKEFHEEWFKQIPIPKSKSGFVTSLLVLLFPALANNVWPPVYGFSEIKMDSRKNLRICSPDIFDIYFKLALPEGNISNLEMSTALSLACKRQAFEQRLAELTMQRKPDGSTRVSQFLERMEDFTRVDIPADNIPNIVSAFFNEGEEILRARDVELPWGIPDNSIRLGRVLWQLLNRFDEGRRFEMLKEAVSKGRSLSLIVDEVATYGQQHGKYEGGETLEEERIVNREHLEELERLALMRIREFAKKGLLFQATDLGSILFRWRDWGDTGEAAGWVREFTRRKTSFLSFLVKMRSYGRLNPRRFEDFLDLGTVYERSKRLIKDKKLTEEQRDALREYIKGYEGIQKGESPDSHLFDWGNRKE